MTQEAPLPELELDPGELPTPDRPTPATLLCAQFRLTEFVEDLQGSVLAQLSAWCATPGPFATLVLTGPAGAGKTRLALELCRSMRAEGWHTGFLGSRDRPPLVGALRRPTLVILDYAEALPRLRELLAALARAGTSDGPSLRVVLLARVLGEWWTTLGEERLLAGPLAHAVTLEIGVAPLDPAARTRFQQGATSAFAALLGKPLPASIAPAPEDRGPLWLLAAALVRVLGSDAAEPFTAILAHEERLWCEAMRHRLDSDRLERRFRRHARRIVAALVLRGGAADEEELRALVVSVGGEELREFADVLRELYPGGEGAAGWVRPLAPDVLGETLVRETLSRYPGAFEAMLGGIDDTRAEHVPHVLLRVAQRAPAGDPQATCWLSRMLDHDLMAYASPTATAVLAGSPGATALRWASTLAGALARRGDPEIGRRVLERVPEHTTALIRVGAWASDVVGRWLPPVDNPAWEAMRADICERAAVYAQRDGQRGRALLWGRQAARILRALAGRDAGYSARLAVYLRNQSTLWMDMGEPVAALEVIDECIGLCRKLGAEEPDAGVEGVLAACLDHRGILLSTVGESTRAIASTEESVSLYRALARVRPEHYRRELAAALDNLGGRYRQAGEFGRSLAVTEEALAIYRSLVEATPDDVFLDFMICLNAAASRRARAGALDRAREAVEEAVGLLRPLAADHPGLRDALATSLTNAAAIHRTLGEAATAEAEEVELAGLADGGARSMSGRLYLWVPGEPADQEVATPGGRLALAACAGDNAGLAMDHDVRSRVLRQAGDLDEALTAAEAAVAALESATDEGAPVQRMVVLNNLANRQADAGRHAIALETTRHVLELAEELARGGDANACGFLPLARINLAVRYCEHGEYAVALPLAEAAVAEIRPSVAGDPHRGFDLANALGILSRCLEGLGRAEEATAAMAEADRVAADAVDRQLGELELPPPLPGHAWRSRLCELLAVQVSSHKLRALVADLPTLARLFAALPTSPCTPGELAAAFVDASERYGALDDEFFVRLHAALPRCTLQISLAHALWHTEHLTRGVG